MIWNTREKSLFFRDKKKSIGAEGDDNNGVKNSTNKGKRRRERCSSKRESLLLCLEKPRNCRDSSCSQVSEEVLQSHDETVNDVLLVSLSLSLFLS
jgi:hypothetical protein